MLLLPANDACRNVIAICRYAENWGFNVLIATLLSDKYRYIDQQLLFFLGIASPQREDCPCDVEPKKHQENMCNAYPMMFF